MFDSTIVDFTHIKATKEAYSYNAYMLGMETSQFMVNSVDIIIILSLSFLVIILL